MPGSSSAPLALRPHPALVCPVRRHRPGPSRAAAANQHWFGLCPALGGRAGPARRGLVRGTLRVAAYNARDARVNKTVEERVGLLVADELLGAALVAVHVYEDLS